MSAKLCCDMERRRKDEGLTPTPPRPPRHQTKFLLKYNIW